MDKQQAFEQVRQIAHSYWADEVGWISLNQILEQFLEPYRHGGSPLSLRKYEGLKTILAESGDGELDAIVHDEFGVSPDQVGGGRKFLLGIQDAIEGTLNNSTKQ